MEVSRADVAIAASIGGVSIITVALISVVGFGEWLTSPLAVASLFAGALLACVLVLRIPRLREAAIIQLGRVVDAMNPQAYPNRSPVLGVDLTIVYPWAAVALDLEGHANVHLVLDAEGHAVAVKHIEASHPVFRCTAQLAFRGVLPSPKMCSLDDDSNDPVVRLVFKLADVQ